MVYRRRGIAQISDQGEEKIKIGVREEGDM